MKKTINFYPQEDIFTCKSNKLNNNISFDSNTQTSIESGYFVFTLMPSLRCNLKCPHCYLSKEERISSPTMSLEQLVIASQKVDDYYQENLPNKNKLIMAYWYGGEPTQMGMDYIESACNAMSNIFTKDKGYSIRHIFLTSLIDIDDQWMNFFNKHGNGYFQTSFDGLMRGKRYKKKWDLRVRDAIKKGLNVSTISVVNNTLFNDGPERMLDYLVDLGITESSFLPFMLNEQNKGKSYTTFAPLMKDYSKFMIALSKHWLKLKKEGKKVPFIGQMSYIISRMKTPASANIAGQTMFLLPEGDFVLPDYKDKYLEYNKKFGNIFESDFKTILTSKERRSYIRRQYTRNNNNECSNCLHKNYCIMEFWKENRENDDCFGAKDYVEWLINNSEIVAMLENEFTVIA